MLRSLTRRLGLENDLRIGIALSRSSVCAVAVSGAVVNPHIAWIKQAGIERPLFMPDQAGTMGDSLYKALKPVVDSIKDEAYPIHIVVPDFVIRTATFELDELPKSQTTLSSLATWRMSNELGRSEEELECQQRVLGEDNGKQLLYVQAGDRRWLDQIRSTFGAFGATPWSINSSSHFRHNYLNHHGVQASSVLLSLDDDSWTLQICDEDTRIRHTSTRLRKSPALSHDVDLIANEANRVLRAWQVNHPGFKFNALYLDASKESADILSGRTLDLFSEVKKMSGAKLHVSSTIDAESSLTSVATMAAVTE